MKKLLVTGGTVFVSRYIAEYYVAKGYEVYVLNRNTKEQPAGVKLIQADRQHLGNVLQGYHFDVVIDTGYTSEDVELLLDALDSYDDYILISSSAVYPEYCEQPFGEDTQVGLNKYWGMYGINKIEAENALAKRNKNAYILRPPYLYGELNNVYREAFVFDCAMQDRYFYLPKDGEMKLQFLHMEDVCRFIDILLDKRPEQRIYNVGNSEAISVSKWVEMCYSVAGKTPKFKSVYDDIEQRKYFSFAHYEYYLDVSKQHELMPDEKDLYEGLREAFMWYKDNQDKVNKKPYIEFIDSELLSIVEFKENDIDIVYEVQRKAYKPLYDKYHDDDMSPYMESKETILQKYMREGTQGYIFYKGDVPVGAVRISFCPENKSGRVSALGVFPQYQGQGIARRALLEIERIHSDVEKWYLDTILEEEGNCHLYEKIGYKRIGDTEKIKDNMTLVYYEKIKTNKGETNDKN